MISRTIHYCWFGRNPKPVLAEKCIDSWRKYCPDYEIIEWNEDNYDISNAPLYVQQAYEVKKWAFVTDYVRLHVVYENGGIYLDTDVELLKNFDNLLENNAFFGFENGIHVATGLGFGAVRGLPILKEMMQDYESIPYVLPDGSYDSVPCPQRNTAVLVKYGLEQNNSMQIVDDCVVYPSDYFCPIDYSTGKKKITKNTYSIHHFSGSWQTKELKKRHKRNVRKKRKRILIDYVIHIPNRVVRTLLGVDTYEKLKSWCK